MTKKEKVLLDAVQYYHSLLLKTGKKDELIKSVKNKTIETYEEVLRHFPGDEVKEIMNISEQKIFKLKTSGCCNASLSKNCLKLNPNQITLWEQQIIKRLLEDEQLKHLPINHIWAYAKREGIVMSKDTFYKYSKKLGIRRSYRKEKTHKIEIHSPKATYPFQILHMDSTYWICNNGERVHIHFIQDNFSRKILGGVVEFSIKSKEVVVNLKNVIEDNQLQKKTLELYCDDGPENKKEVDAYLAQKDFKIKKVVANYKTKKTNNSIEAWNKTFKRVVLRKFRIESADMMRKKLPEMLAYYNNLYLPTLNSLSPNEVVSGKTYRDLEMEAKIKQAKARRICVNQNLCCHLKEAEDYSQYDCRKVLDIKEDK